MSLRDHLLTSSHPFSPQYAPPDDAVAGAAGAADAGTGGDAAADTKDAAADTATDGGEAGKDGATDAKDGDQGDDKGGADDKAKDGEKPEPKPDWRDKEIGKKHAQNKAKDAEIEKLRKEIADRDALIEAATRKGGDAGATGGEPLRQQFASKAEFDTAVKAEAERVASQTQMQRDIESTESKGRKDYGEERWTKSLAILNTLGFQADDLPAILATDDPAKVLFDLGNNPENYQRIMDLSPMKRQAEFIKLSLAVAPKPKPSDAPKPVDTIGARGSSDNTSLSDDLPEDEWRRRRMEQKNKSVGRPWSGNRRAG